MKGQNTKDGGKHKEVKIITNQGQQGTRKKK